VTGLPAARHWLRMLSNRAPSSADRTMAVHVLEEIDQLVARANAAEVELDRYRWERGT
jgi:hypothetical protein